MQGWVELCVRVLGRPHQPHAGQPYPWADLLWAAGYGETSTKWAGQKVRRRHQESHEMVRNQRCGPVQRLTQSHLLATLCHKAAAKFEDTRLSALEHRRAVWKFGAQPLNNPGAWPCSSCSRICNSRIGLYTHERTHWWQEAIRRSDGAVRSVCVCVCVCVHVRACTLWSRVNNFNSAVQPT